MWLLDGAPLVFVVGLVTGLATGLGVLPFFLVEEIPDRWLVALWGLAAGIMLSASVFGLLAEGLAEGSVLLVSLGLCLGAALVYAADRLIGGYEFTPAMGSAVDYRTAALTVGVLTVHSVPEGIAVGVAFTEMAETAENVAIAGIEMPELAAFMAVAISVLNVPEGLALAIPLVSLGVRRTKIVGWAIVSGLPQPIGAVLAYYFVNALEGLLPVAFGFAAGALLYLLATEFVPAGLEHGAALAGRGRSELGGGFGLGFVATTAMVVALGV
ncbi:ZIP family metal transporter [Halalkalicoccus tibetensis]|uniref:ZIP family metal transporter n=1 Tax=Halalkalicoccus tibetensis TaxID=175632 RepID=A0ABD5V359_9EURY